MPHRVQRTRKAGQPGMPPGARYAGRPTGLAATANQLEVEAMVRTAALT